MTILKEGWGRKLKLASVTVFLAGLAACTTPFKADVQRFQAQLPAPTATETFAVVADDPALAGGLEFSQYADMVKARMQRLGYVPAADVDSAKLLVRFDYGVDHGRERIRTTGFADPFYSPWYGYGGFYGGWGRGWGPGFGPGWGGYRPWGYGFYDPWFNGPEVTSYTVYTSDISLKIDRASTGERLFEGKAKALSTSSRLSYLVPNLIDAMFTDFPGNSGETLRISIAPDKTTVRQLN